MANVNTHRPSGRGGGSPYKGKRTKCDFRIPVKLKEKLKQESSAHDISVNDVVICILEEYFKQKVKNQ